MGIARARTKWATPATTRRTALSALEHNDAKARVRILPTFGNSGVGATHCPSATRACARAPIPGTHAHSHAFPVGGRQQPIAATCRRWATAGHRLRRELPARALGAASNSPRLAFYGGGGVCALAGNSGRGGGRIGQGPRPLPNSAAHAVWARAGSQAHGRLSLRRRRGVLSG